MSILDSVLAFKLQREKEARADIEAIPTAINNFLTMRQQQTKNMIDLQTAELNRRNIESQIKERKSGNKDFITNLGIVEKLGSLAKNRPEDKELGKIYATAQDSLLGTNSLNSFVETKPEKSQEGQTVNRQEAMKSTLDELSAKPNMLSSFTQPNLVEPEKDVWGNLTSKGKLQEEQNKLAIKQAEAGIEVGKQVSAQQAKSAEEMGRQTTKAASALDTSFDAVTSFDIEQYDKYNIKPGDFLGLAAKLTPKQLNQFKSAATAAGKESAGQVGKQILPSARGVNLLSVFEKSSAELGNSSEANAQNVAFTYGNLFANAITDNIMEVDTRTGQQVPIQNLTIDPRTNLPISQLPFHEKNRAINDLKRDFIRKTSENYIMNVFKRKPELLKPETFDSIVSTLPEYASEEEGNNSLPAGEMFLVDGQLARSDGPEGVQ